MTKVKIFLTFEIYYNNLNLDYKKELFVVLCIMYTLLKGSFYEKGECNPTPSTLTSLEQAPILIIDNIASIVNICFLNEAVDNFNDFTAYCLVMYYRISQLVIFTKKDKKVV